MESDIEININLYINKNLFFLSRKTCSSIMRFRSRIATCYWRYGERTNKLLVSNMRVLSPFNLCKVALNDMRYR